MAEIANHAEREPWPSLESASWWFDRASLLLIGSLIAGAIATVIIVWTGTVKEEHWDIMRSRSNERIAEAKLGAAKADENAAIANAAAATANERAALLEVEAAKLRGAAAWRRLTVEQHEKLKESLDGQSFEVWTSFVGADPESTVFRNDIDKALSAGGLKTKFFSGWSVAVGLQITDTPGPQRDALIRAFTAASLPFKVVPVLQSNGNFGKELTIIVGTKPPPF